MGVQVVDVGEGNTGQRGGVADDGEDEPNERREVSHSGISTAQDGEGVTELHVGMEFDSAEAAKSFYDEYASRMGFNVRAAQISRSKSNGTLGIQEYLCAMGGLKRRAADSCSAMLRIEFNANKKWVVTKFVKEHSHSTKSANKVHYLRPCRHFAGVTKTAVEAYPGIGIVPSGAMFVSVDGNPVTPEINSSMKNTHGADMNHTVKNDGKLNYAPKQYARSRTLGRNAQNLLDYFKKMQAENPGFYYAIQLDEDNRMANIFWADARSRTAYRCFGDAVTLDTMYRANHYIVPFAPFTGVNHHGQTILFACALILDDSEAAFVWLFKTFIACMNDQAPVTMTTDQDKAIQAAVAQVLPGSRHCINKWHVLREGQESMAPVCHTHPSFQRELYSCINLTKTVEEFESSWNSILEKYDLRGNEWLRSIYATRTQWVPVYFRDSFSAIIYPTQGFPTSFFEGYVSQQTTLPLFFRQYERALQNSFEKEIEADFGTVRTAPVLRTPSPMEKQAASMYTRKVFSKFQEELVETFAYTANRIDGSGASSTFRVAKFENDRKAYSVSLNTSEMKANCSCQMFEYSGILCRHILTVFTVTNVLTLPSHYILKRWTINAKSGNGGSDENGELHVNESLAVRYNNLCKEALRCAEDGAIEPEVYRVALTALREASKKVAAARKHVAKVPSSSNYGTGSAYGNQRPPALASDMAPLLWPRQDEMTRRFNLNDVGVPAQSTSDINLPRTAPVSLNREDGHPDTMGILPCLKSMTWVMEQKDSISANRSALITLKLQDYSRIPPGESEVKFHLSQATLEPMLRSMSYISEQLSAPANRVAVINLKLQDTEASSGESEVKFQVSRDTLGAMLRSMAYIREQLSNPVETKPEQPQLKKQRK